MTNTKTKKVYCDYYNQNHRCQEPASSTGLCSKHELEYQQFVAAERANLHSYTERLFRDILKSRVTPQQSHTGTSIHATVGYN